VALARVLVLGPDLLLMDEPFSALDANTRERLQDELLRIWEADRKTVLFVTHNVEEAAYLADRVIVLGPPPYGVRADMTALPARPRKRFSEQLREITETLRAELDDLPCCMPPRQGEIRPWNEEK
jgi:NitT/TauT family transport system ATP-binding protein